MGQAEDSEEEDAVEEGGCLDDDLLGCRVGCSPGERVERFTRGGWRFLGHPGGSRNS